MEAQDLSWLDKHIEEQRALGINGWGDVCDYSEADEVEDAAC
jgi:hypothetical protein